MTSKRYSLRARDGVLALVLLAGATMAADVASAQPVNGRAPWCVNVGLHGGTLDCAYHSLEQCMASASGVSNQCSLNPWYAGPARDPRPRQAASSRSDCTFR